MLRFTIRDMLCLTVVVALAMAWRLESRQRQAGSEALKKTQAIVDEQGRELDSVELFVNRDDGSYLGTVKSWAKKRRKKRETEEALAGKYDPDKALVGEWQVVELIYKGKVEHFQDQPAGWMTFQYGKWSEAYSDHRYVFQCDYTIVGPGEIDVNMKGLFGRAGSIWKALYEHKDGQLHLVWNNQDPEQRPTHFDAMGDPGLKFYALKKVP